MGGWGSNRWPAWHQKKAIVDDCLILDIAVLRRAGFLSRETAPRAWLTLTARWQGRWASVDGRVESIGPHLECRLSYVVDRPGHSHKERIEQSVRLQTTGFFWGGRRYWFTCPMGEGTLCHRPVAKLYLPPKGRFYGCRGCHQLSYRSCQEDPRRFRLLVLGYVGSRLQL